MNALELRCRSMTGPELADAMDRNQERFDQERRARDLAATGEARELHFQGLIRTERERRALEAEMRSRGIGPPLGNRGRSRPVHLRRHRARPGLTEPGRDKLPVVGYREVRMRDERITVLAVVSTLEDGVWRSDLMRLHPCTAAGIEAGLTGEDEVQVLQRMYRERGERGEP